MIAQGEDQDLPKRVEGQDYQILMVDDEPVALELFRYNFSDQFRILTANSADEAQELVDQHADIAVILADQRMPGKTGTDFFAEIQGTHPEIVRILVTGYVDFKSLVSAINSGRIYQYIEKPWSDRELRIILQRSIEHFHLTRERDRLQKERIQTLEKMARSNRLAAVGTLAAGIAHEIRNPLSAIITFHQMLPERLDELAEDPNQIHTDEYWTTFSKIPLKEVERIKKLIDELLDFSRSSSGLHFQKTKVPSLFKEFLPMIETDLRRSGVEMEMHYAEHLPEVEMDSDKIKQVLINFILNAMQSCHGSGKIKVRVEPWKNPDFQHKEGQEEYKGCRISVEDNGEGIAPENVEKIFDPFFTTRDPGRGTGLGLTMCYHIIQQHHGEVRVDSEMGQGSTFSILIPSHQDEQGPKSTIIPVEGLFPAASV